MPSNYPTQTDETPIEGQTLSDAVLAIETDLINPTTGLAAKAPLASPALTGSPTAPTQTANDNSTKIATTAYTDAVKGLPIGLTGATAATRYVGGTTSGAPTSGTFAVGDFVVDRSAAIWICTAAGTPGTWSTISGGSGGGVTAVTAADASIVVGGTTSAPTIATGTLDVVATQHPPAAAVAMNAKKITGLANGTVSTDAAALGQIPVGTGSVNQGLKAATLIDIGVVSGTITLTAGVQYFFQINVPYTITATNYLFRTVAAASGLTSGYLGLYTQAGALISGSPTANTTTFAAATNYTLSMTSSQTLTPGTYYVGVLFYGGTPPTLIGVNAGGLFIGPTSSAGTLAGNGRALTSGSGQSSLLASVSGTPALVNTLVAIGLI